MFGRRKHHDLEEPSAASPVDVAVATIDDASFLASTAGGYTLVDFWAPWCAPCRAFGPMFEEVATCASERVRFARCNIDESPATAALLQIRSVPTVIAFGPDGSELRRIVGVPRRSDLEQTIADLQHP